MAAPTPPVRGYSFTDFSTANPSTPHQGDKLDQELDRANAAIADVIAHVAVSLDDTGAIKAGAVGEDQLAPGVVDGIIATVLPDLTADVTAAQNAAAAALSEAAAAAASADASASSATAASGHAGTATTQAGNAAGSAATALSYANAATNKANDAANSANDAQGHAAQALLDQELAGAWAEYLDGVNPIPPSFLAHTGVTGDHWSARYWANAAAQSASAADASADSAAASAADADTAASAAQAAEAGATAAYEDFIGLYYGPLAADPATDPNGGAPTAGDFYFNTVSGAVRFYDGATWAEVSGIDLTAYARLDGANFVGLVSVGGDPVATDTDIAAVNSAISARVAKGGDTMTGALTLPASDPTTANQAARKSYVDAQRDTRVAKAGDTMTGALTLPASNPTTDNHAARKAYVDAQRDTRVAKAGDTMTGALTLPSTDPTADDHAARKAYVDDALTAATTFTASGTGAVDRTTTEKLGERRTPEDFGAAGDGVTDDSAAFALALAPAGTLHLTRGRTYLVKDLDINNRTIVGNGAILRAAAGARWIIRLRGSYPVVSNLQLEDPTQQLVRQTTLSAGASAGASSVTVASAANIEARMAVAIELDSGEWHCTVVASIAGSTLTLDRALPTGAVASAGKRVWAMHAAVWLADVRYFELRELWIKSVWGAVTAKPITLSGQGAEAGTISGVKTFGARFFGSACHGNSNDTNWHDVYHIGSTNLTATYAGNGSTTVFAAPEAIKRVGAQGDARVRVNGVLLTQGTDFTVTGPAQVTLTTAPASGATVEVISVVDGLIGHWCNQTGATTTSGGHDFDLFKILDFQVGVQIDDAELLNFGTGVSDTCSVDALRLTGDCDSIVFDGFRLTYAWNSCIRAVGAGIASSVRFIALRTSLWLGAEKNGGGGLGNALHLDTGSVVTVDTTTWAVGPRTLTGGGSYRTLGDAASFITPGGEQFRIADAGSGGSAVNYIEASGANTGGSPGVRAKGSDTNVGLFLGSQGSGAVFVNSPSGIVELQRGGVTQFRAGLTLNESVQPLRLPVYTVGTLPAAGSFTRCVIYVSDGTSNKRLAISDGTNWRWPDGAVVS